MRAHLVERQRAELQAVGENRLGIAGIFVTSQGDHGSRRASSGEDLTSNAVSQTDWKHWIIYVVG
jgi:hypothetical protein